MKLVMSKMTQKWSEFGKKMFKYFARQSGKFIIAVYERRKDFLYNVVV